MYFRKEDANEEPMKKSRIYWKNPSLAAPTRVGRDLQDLLNVKIRHTAGQN
jgi:hypothetical protein